MPAKPEAFSRVLIDQALRESGWDLLDDRRVRFELDGHSGRADYVLSGARGPLCVLEAKRPDLDPYEAKEQARGYAENLRAPLSFFPTEKSTGFGITNAPTSATPSSPPATKTSPSSRKSSTSSGQPNPLLWPDQRS